jgi:hypothetical protein
VTHAEYLLAGYIRHILNTNIDMKLVVKYPFKVTNTYWYHKDANFIEGNSVRVSNTDIPLIGVPIFVDSRATSITPTTT